MGSEEVISSEDGLQKRKKKKKTPKKIMDGLENGKAVQRKKHKLKSYELGTREEERASSPSEDVEELTVEDLMSIAEEYVEKADDNTKEHQREATAAPELEKKLSATSIFFGNESGVSIEAAQRSEVSRMTQSSSSLSNFTSSKHMIQDSMTMGNQETGATEDVGFSQRRIGDPTQDMLDLFLGPLLMKPRVEERRLEVVEQDIILDSDLSKKEALQKTVVPSVAKKKSSLKDKVTLFLG